MTALGPVGPEQPGITDAHNHPWIDIVQGSATGSSVLNSFAQILAVPENYMRVGGTSVLDCQPGGCGRNGPRLAGLSRDSDVRIVACTGFRRHRCYPMDYWPCRATAGQAAQHFTDEATHCLVEAREQPEPVRAGFINIAFESTVRGSSQEPLRGAAAATASTGLALEVHMEKGADVENLVTLLIDLGVLPAQLVLCHMDERPDLALHRELGRTGVVLEYDTFFRPQYEPEANLWPLIGEMASAGHSDSPAFATDMAEAGTWQSLGGGPGLCALVADVIPRLQALGLDESDIRRLVGGNIPRCLAGTETTPSRS